MDKTATLEKEYCPPLDPALFHAIISDYDLGNEEQLTQARGILNGLCQTADVESATGFDASGTGSTHSHLGTGDAARNGHDSASRTLTDLTDVTNSTASLALDGANSVSSDSVVQHLDENFEDLQTDQKQAILAEAFPDLDLGTIIETLADCGFGVERALEELLTKRFLQEEQDQERERPIPKGIDGFIRTDELQPYPGKAKRRKKPNRGFPASSSRLTGEAAKLMPQYSKLSIDDDETTGVEYEVVQSARTKGLGRFMNTVPANVTAATFNAAKQEAFAKAAAAARRSRSDRLMGGAASYYASVGRDARDAAGFHSAKAADELATRNSTASRVDLHGIDVKNAVRIALEKVQWWWDSGVNEWSRQGKAPGDEGFSVVTGIGRHSEGGKAKIAPAVKKALIAHGWRVEDNGGILWVRGRARS